MSMTGLIRTREQDAISQRKRGRFLRRPPANTGHNSSPPPNTSLSQRLNLPNDELIVGGSGREGYMDICVPLYQASINGDWKAANLILYKKKELVRFGITENLDTALHIATSGQHTKFVKLLVESMDDKDLELQNKKGNTAFCLAAIAGNVKLMQIMLDRNKALLTIPGSQGMMPLDLATLFGNHQAVNYLYDNSDNMIGGFWTSHNRGRLLLKCIEADLFDIAIKIWEHHEELAQSESVLGVMARKPYAFNNVPQVHFMQRFINSILASLCIQIASIPKESEAMKLLRMIWRSINVKMSKFEIHNLLKGPCDTIWKDGKQTVVQKDGKPTYSSKILFVAVKNGNYKFVVELIRQYPDVIWELDENNQSIFHVAVSYRQAMIYNLIYEIGPMKDMIIPLIDPHGNNILHLVGKKSKKNQPENVSRVAFQMQKELLWFKEVEAIIPVSYREMKNNDGLTPIELFTLNHEELVSSCAKWMKATVSQCMVVAALVATIVFTVAFTIPGGYDQDTGFPKFLQEKTFLAFVIADATSLIFSSASILIFLSIITSRYVQRDFLEKLPQKLILGLAFLFYSIITMMVAFIISFYVLYRSNLVWIPCIIGVFAVIPVSLYGGLQYPLLLDAFRSTYAPWDLLKPKKRTLYNINPMF